MLKSLFLAPGRLLAKLFSREKKKTYRSTRQRPKPGLGTVILSVVGWLAVAAVLLFAADKAGLMDKALDAGAEAVNRAEQEAETRPSAETVGAQESEPSTGSASGSLTGRNGAAPAANPASGPPESSATPNTVTPESEQWLVILHTIPKSARDEAERRKTQYRGNGLAVDILDTDAFPRLLSGNWIIALGPFDEKNEALEAANHAKTYNSKLIVRRGL